MSISYVEEIITSYPEFESCQWGEIDGRPVSFTFEDTDTGKFYKVTEVPNPQEDGS